jgi:hypothetical protein
VYELAQNSLASWLTCIHLELHNTVRMIKLRWAGHIAYMGEKKNAYCFGLKT